MSNATIVDPYITTLSTLQAAIVRYSYPILCAIGNIGCLLNIIILLKPNYRRNPCSSYILANSITCLINLNILIATRNLIEINSWINRVAIYCQIRQYISQTGSAASRIYLVFACIDRWALTSRSVRIRSFAQIKVSRIVIPAIPIIWSILTIHVPLNQGVVNGQCAWTSRTYSIFYNIYNTVMTGFIIPGAMIIFSILCILNVRRLRQRVHIQSSISRVISINEQSVRRNIVNKKAYDYQLLFMILVQIFVYIFTNIPYICNLFYAAITINWTKSSLQLAIDSFWANIVQILVYLNFSVTFYIYTLAAPVFRKDLKRLLFRNYVMNKIFPSG